MKRKEGIWLKLRNKIPRFRLLPIIIVVVALLFSIPAIKPPIYLISVFFFIFMYIALSESWIIFSGYTGYISFGHVAFFGVGAYTTALFLKHLGLSPFLTVVVAGISAAVLAALVGKPCFRLKGPYFAIVTFLLVAVIQQIFMNLDYVGGSTGLWLKAMPVGIRAERTIFYEVMLALAIIVVLIARRVEKSKFGAGLVSIREDEDTAQTLGINTPRLKIMALILSAFFTGIIGGIYAYYISYLHPDSTFSMDISLLIILIAFFGGSLTWVGPIIGAIILVLVNEFLTTFIGAEIARIIYGLLFVLVILFMPNGITGRLMTRG